MLHTARPLEIQDLELDTVTRWDFTSSPLDGYDLFHACSSIDCCTDIFFTKQSFPPPYCKPPYNKSESLSHMRVCVSKNLLLYLVTEALRVFATVAFFWPSLSNMIAVTCGVSFCYPYDYEAQRDWPNNGLTLNATLKIINQALGVDLLRTQHINVSGWTLFHSFTQWCLLRFYHVETNRPWKYNAQRSHGADILVGDNQGSEKNK